MKPTPADNENEATEGRTQAARDAVDLADLGHRPAFSRNFDTWSMLALAFNILGTWSTEAQDLSSGLLNGGPITILWGLVAVTICNVCVALSMGELCSSMPTALGQAFWISRLCKGSSGRFLSYLCAWVNTFGWWALTASSVAFMTNLILSARLMSDNDWDGATKGWVPFLVYIGLTIFCTLVNQFGGRHARFLPWFNQFIGVWYIVLFLAIGLGLLISVGIRPDKHFQPATFVFGKWINETGWPDGVAWFGGLVQAAYGLTAFDSVIHMIEEIPAPRRNGPKSMYMSVICGAATGFVFMAICLGCIQNLGAVLDSPSRFPFLQIMQDAVGLKAATVLLSLFIVNGVGQAIGVSTSASRLTWSFARDGGIPFSNYFQKVDPRWQVPTRALWLQAAIVGAIGTLELFADAVLQAILSVSTIALTVSYAMPIAVLLGVGRKRLPPGEFRLGRLATTINVISIAYCIITSVFFFFPSRPNPSVDDMNHAIAVFGVMMMIALGFWFVQGRASYQQIEATDAGETDRLADQPMSHARAVSSSVAEQDGGRDSVAEAAEGSPVLTYRPV